MKTPLASTAFDESLEPYKNEAEYLSDIKRVYREDYGIELSDGEASKIASQWDTALEFMLR